MSTIPNGIAGMACAGMAGFALARHNYLGVSLQLLLVAVNIVIMVRFSTREKAKAEGK